MKAIVVIFCACCALIVTSTFSQMRSGENVVIDEAVNDDLYIAAGMVTINAPVRGDLIAAGGTIVINDSVTQDILVAGGAITLNGFVGDDIRCAGGRIEVSSIVKGDLVVAGGTIEIKRTGVVFGDLLTTGGEILVDGTVNGAVTAASGTFIFNGRIGEDVRFHGGKIVINGPVDGESVLASRNIELGQKALFKNDVRYWTESGELDFEKALLSGNAVYDTSLQQDDGKWHYLGFASALVVLWYLATATVMMLLIQYLFRQTFRSAADTVKKNALKSLGLGFLFVVGLPVMIIVTVVSVIGLPIGILLLVAYVTILLLATVIVSLLAANWINNTYYQRAWHTGRVVIVACAIFIFLKLFTLTPVIGALIMLLLACMSFGALLLTVKWRGTGLLN